MRVFTLFTLSILITTTVLGQNNPQRDSLYQELKKYPKTDITHIDILHKIAETYTDSSPKKMVEIARKAEKIAHEINYPAGIIGSLILYSAYYQQLKQPDTALVILHKARKISHTIKNYKIAKPVYTHIRQFYSNHNQNDSVIKYLTEYLQIYKHHDKEYLPLMYSSIAVSHYYLGNLDSAISCSKLGVEAAKRTNNLDAEATLLNILASSLKRKGEIDTAIYYFNRIIEIAKETKDLKKQLFAYNNIANIYGDRGNNPKALDYYLLTLGVAEDIDQENVKAVIYNNIAIVYYTIKDYPETIFYLKKSLEVARKLDEKTNIANALNNIGELYLNQDSLQKALEYYNEATPIILQLKEKLLYINNLKGKADVYQKMKQKDSAKVYYLKALSLSESVGATEHLAKSHIGISRFYFDVKNYTQASKLSRKAIILAKELGQVDIIKEAAEILYQSNAKLLKYKEAYHFLSLYTKMNDSILSSDNIKEVTQLQMQYEHDKELQQIEAQERVRELERQKEIVRQKNLRNTFIVAFVLVLLIVIQVIKSSRQKQKANQQLAFQKAEIEEKNEELQQLMSEVSRQKDEIELTHTKITDSIRYARRIQSALFPIGKEFKQNIKEFFVLYEPLEIVSGDFYWFERVQNHILIAVADCTGHGVPGAMMSMLGISYLNELVRQPHITKPSHVLEELRNRVKRSLHQTGNVREARDGMDIAFVDINTTTNELLYSGANNPLIIFRNNEMLELKADRQPISVYPNEKPFTNQKITIKKDDVIYLFSDGYRDQFQRDTGRKYGKKRFRELLAKIHKEPMNTQKNIMKKELKDWMKEKMYQLDDILVAGFRW